MKQLIFRWKEFSRQMSRLNISAHAASTAFFLFLSLIPMIVVICAVIPYTPLTKASLVAVARTVFPETVDGLLVSIISQVYEKSAGILSVAILATIWSAGKGVLALIRGLNSINNVVENRNYFVLRLVSSFYTLVMLIILVICVSMAVFGNELISGVILVVVFTTIYTYVPNKKLKFLEQIPGAVFASVAWMLFSWGFSVYVEHSDGITAYGTLSIIVTMLLWLYIGIYIVMIGAYINRYYKRRWKR